MLSQIRESKGHTQASLAELVGCTPQTISAYELGKAAMSVSRAKELAAILSCKWTDFFPDESTSNEPIMTEKRGQTE